MTPLAHQPQGWPQAHQVGVVFLARHAQGTSLGPEIGRRPAQTDGLVARARAHLGADSCECRPRSRGPQSATRPKG